MIINPGSTRLRATTVQIADPGPLSSYLGPNDQAFLHGQDGFVALGEIARFETKSMAEADRWWAEQLAMIENQSEMPGRFGTGPIAIGSFLFDPNNSTQNSVLIIPEIVIGRRDGVSWITQIGIDDVEPQLPARTVPPRSCGQLSFNPPKLSEAEWMEVVASVVARIRAGEARKVVLARELIAQAEKPIDPRWPLEWLSNSYGACWTYLVDGLVGSTPEMLLSRRGGLTSSRVLAGTIQRVDGVDDTTLASRLMASVKDIEEHRMAVESVVEALRPHLSAMHVTEAPFVLPLPNVMHLATDICGVSKPESTTLALAEAAHPSAAVCGRPTERAREIIAETEQLDRGRFAGVVGWIDAQGDGEWALALRCGRLDADDPRVMHLYAGAGMVAQSVPHAELVETEAKFAPMKSALRQTS